MCQFKGSVHRAKFSVCQKRGTGPRWNLYGERANHDWLGSRLNFLCPKSAKPAGAGIILTLMLKNYDKYDTILMPLNPADPYEPPFWIV